MMMLFVVLMKPVTVRADDEIDEGGGDSSSTAQNYFDEALEYINGSSSSGSDAPADDSEASGSDEMEFNEDSAAAYVDDELLDYSSLMPEAITPFSVTGAVYQGTISTTYLEYFKGFLLNGDNLPYVIFRSDAYNYYMFYGKELSLSGYRFTGSGKYIRYYTQTGLIYRGTDTVNIDATSGFVYSNMSDDFPSIYEERQIFNEKIIIIMLCVFVGLWVLGKLFFRGR